ncbi:hypothetical protein NOV18_20245 [Pseudomonas asiatica]|uniref:Uncharacterized protein n=1 Tax=Pseudomonas asiatica TaxID=2219225 RepID=A0AAJ5LJW2_9PSED|nr:hypothetical protein [Pseudomonas asiatica]UUC17578.1 hypothetical protein NOV18_20245 [Pseudomonas asiatica]
MTELIKPLAETGVLAIILMFIGWVFVYKNSRALARQSEINSMAAALEKTLQEIADENYKFWKEADADEQAQLEKSRIFNAYIEYRCNIVEKKVFLLFEKAKDCLNPAVEYSPFPKNSVELIAKIRDRSTMNSENISSVKDRYSRISGINHLTLKMFNEVNGFIALRFQPMDEWEFHSRY